MLLCNWFRKIVRKIYRSDNKRPSRKRLNRFCKSRCMFHMMSWKSQKIDFLHSREKLIDPTKMLSQAMIFCVFLLSFKIKDTPLTINGLLWKRFYRNNLIFKFYPLRKANTFKFFLLREKVVWRKQDNLIWTFSSGEILFFQKTVKMLNSCWCNHKMRNNSKIIFPLNISQKERSSSSQNQKHSYHNNDLIFTTHEV